MKLTKEQAREYLKDKYVPVFSLEDAFKALLKFEQAGFEIDEYVHESMDVALPWHVLPDDEDEVGVCWNKYREESMDKETFELPLQDLLAIEIIEIDYKSLYEEAVACIENMIEYSNAGKTLRKIDSHVASIGRDFLTKHKGGPKGE